MRSKHDIEHIGIHQFFTRQNFPNPDSSKFSIVKILRYTVFSDCCIRVFCVLGGLYWEARVKAIVDHVISKWEQFTIWNAGKEGRRFYRSLYHDDQQKVILKVYHVIHCGDQSTITGGGVL